MTIILPLLILQLGCSCGSRMDSAHGDSDPTTDTETDTDDDTDDDTDVVPTDEICDDGIDNDLDGWVDGDDSDCPLRGEVSWDAADLITTGDPAVVMDVDGDGVMDLVHSEDLDDATLYTAVTWQGEPTALSLEVASAGHLLLPDLSGDSTGDLLTTAHYGDGGLIELWAGPLTEQGSGDPWLRLYQVGHDFYDALRLPDLDGDGHAELALSRDNSPNAIVTITSSALPLETRITGDNSTLLMGEGEGPFGERLSSGDMNGDGLTELGILDSTWPQTTYDEFGAAWVITLPTDTSYRPSETADAVLYGMHRDVLADFTIVPDRTGDGYDDTLLVVEWTATLLEGPLEGELDRAAIAAAAHTTFDDRSVYEARLVGDVDGDGRDDIGLWGQYAPYAVFFDAQGGSQTDADLEIGPYGYQFSAGFDGNDDGLGELVFQTANSFYLFIGR